MCEALLIADPLKQLRLERLHLASDGFTEKEVLDHGKEHMHFLHTCQWRLAYSLVSKPSRANSVRALAALLRQMREDAGLRQVDLADVLGEPQSFVSRYESGERRLDLLELRDVCNALKLPIEEFIQHFEKDVP